MKKLIPLLIIITLAFGAVSATTFPAPVGTPPNGVIVPVHTGASQVKQGSLSVNTFIARSRASLKDAVYINNSTATGVLRGSRTSTDSNANTVVFGITLDNDPNTRDDDAVYDTSLLGSDRVLANKYLQSGKITHDRSIATKRELCADSEGRVVFCKVATQEVDVCTNIQGLQTNPPTGMITQGQNCVWANVIQPLPLVYVSSIIVTAPPAESLDETLSFACSVNLTIPNNLGETVTFVIKIMYTLQGGGESLFQECTVPIAAGQSVGNGTAPAPNILGASIQNKCIVSEKSTDKVYYSNADRCI